MKRSTIKESLVKYNGNSGYGIRLVKEEPHIKELRKFYEGLNEEELSPASLIQLARILIGKEIKGVKSASAEAFGELSDRLGGHDSLKTLNEANLLNEDIIVFFDKHPQEAKLLLPYIITLAKEILSIKDILIQADSEFKKEGRPYHAYEILFILNGINWDPKPYLSTIISGRNSRDLKIAIEKLLSMKLKKEIEAFILEAILTHADHCLALTAAVDILGRGDLDENLLKLSFAVPEHSFRLAGAFTLLKRSDFFNQATEAYVTVVPQHALGLAHFWIQFSKTGCPKEILPEMLKQAQCASYTAKVIEFLLQKELHSEKNIRAVCSAKLTSDALLGMLNVMSEAKLLDKEHLDLLFSKLTYIKSLYHGAKCLANAKKLDDWSFPSLLADPINAVALAKNSGGKSKSAEEPQFEDPGAKDFTILRQNTQVLCQGYRQRLFFAELSAVKTSKYDRLTQKEILLKIAQESGSHELEKEVEYSIAEQAFKV